jgi:hypothetical protein
MDPHPLVLPPRIAICAREGDWIEWERPEPPQEGDCPYSLCLCTPILYERPDEMSVTMSEEEDESGDDEMIYVKDARELSTIIEYSDDLLRQIVLYFLQQPDAHKPPFWALLDNDGEPQAILITIEHWRNLTDLISESDEADAFYKDPGILAPDDDE